MNNVIRIISGRMDRNRIQYTGVRLDGFINEGRDDSSTISGLFFFFFHLLSSFLSHCKFLELVKALFQIFQLFVIIRFRNKNNTNNRAIM